MERGNIPRSNRSLRVSLGADSSSQKKAKDPAVAINKAEKDQKWKGSDCINDRIDISVEGLTMSKHAIHAGQSI